MTKQCGQERLRKQGKIDAWRKQDKRDGRWYRYWREKGSRKIHHQLESRWVWEITKGSIPKGFDIHHADHNPENNELSNLRCIPSNEHDVYHQRIREDHRITDDGIEERRCQRCGNYKPISEYSKRTAGTYQGYCKSCQLKYQREWIVKHPNYNKEYLRKWRSKSK